MKLSSGIFEPMEVFDDGRSISARSGFCALARLEHRVDVWKAAIDVARHAHEHSCRQLGGPSVSDVHLTDRDMAIVVFDCCGFNYQVSGEMLAARRSRGAVDTLALKKQIATLHERLLTRNERIAELEDRLATETLKEILELCETPASTGEPCAQHDWSYGKCGRCGSKARLGIDLPVSQLDGVVDLTRHPMPVAIDGDYPDDLFPDAPTVIGRT